jgi:hypothetical protein
VSTQQLALFRGPDAVVMLRALECYPTGISFDLVVHTRRHAEVELYPDHRPGRSRARVAELPDEFLRFGVALDDGRYWANYGHRQEHVPFEHEPPAPFVSQHGGGGGGNAWQTRMWLWPLPATGDITFYALCPALGIAEVSAVADGDDLRRCAERAELLWS